MGVKWPGTQGDSHQNVTVDGTNHVVFCPASRRNVLVNGVDTRLKELLTIKAPELQTDSVEMEVMPDHGHLLFQVSECHGFEHAAWSGL